MSSVDRSRLIQVTVSVSLLTLLAWLVDVEGVVSRLAAMRPGWLVLALLVSVAQIVASAWRWRFTAGRLGVELRLERAVAEYYLAAFLNQVLPGGVLGDVSRAWRHSRSSTSDDGSGLRSVHAVVLERASGQAVMVAVALAAVCVLLLPRSEALAPLLPDHPLADVPTAVSAPAFLSALLFGAWLLAQLLRRLRRLPTLHRLLADARSALLGSALPVQASASLLIVGSYVAVFVLSARAVGIDTPTSVLAPLVPVVLLAMLVPVSVAGWGVREGAAAVLWSVVGLTTADGVAVSVAYGVVVLLSSMPGAAVLALVPRMPDPEAPRGPAPERSHPVASSRGAPGDGASGPEAPDRRGDRRRDESAGPAAGSPRRASRSGGG